MSDRKNMLEAYVAERLKNIYKYSRPTIASGATPVEKGDIKNPYFAIECKIRNTDSVSIKNPVWEEIRGIAAREHKDPVYIIQNKKGHRLAVMDLEDWFELVFELLEWRKEHGQ